MTHNMYEWAKTGNFDINLLQKSKSASILKELGLQVPETRHYSSENMFSDSSLTNYVDSHCPILILATPNDKKLDKKGIFDINSVKELSDFVNKIDEKRAYEFALIPQIQGIKEGYVGTARNSGDSIYIELFVEEFVTDLRKLTSTGVDSSKLKSGECFGKMLKTYSVTHRREMCIIRDSCSALSGYYEFIYGDIHGKSGLWFVDYQSDLVFTRLNALQPNNGD
jgi:hypothetical protein